MAKILRVHELAKELGMTNQETLDLCGKLGVPVKNQSSTMIEQQADRVRARAERDGLKRDVQPEEPKPVKKAAKKAAPKKTADDGSEEQPVKKAAKKAVVHNNIINFKNQYETILGERGITLSGGQKQRVSIARALVKDPNILIFDDCLSAVDTKTEEEILHNLGRIMEGKTSIIIAHRISTIKNAPKGEGVMRCDSLNSHI